MNDLVTFLKDLTPLLQTLLWVMVLLVAVFLLRRELGVLLHAITQRATAGAAIEIGPIKLGELGKQLSVVQSQVDEIGKKVTQLFLVTMSPAMFANLEKIASGHFGSFQKSRGLERELYHLRDIGYIEVPSVRGLPREGPDLSQHVRVTDAGREFVRLRRNIGET